MGNLIKMNLFRLRKSKLTYLLGGMTVLLILVILGVTALEKELTTGWYDNDLFATEFYTFLRTCLGRAYLTAFVGLYMMMFLGTDRSTGFIKNIAGYLDNKFTVVGANLLTGAIYLGFLLILALIVSVPMTFVIHDKVTFGSFGSFAAYLGTCLFCTLCVLQVFLLLGDLTKRHFLFGILGMIYMFLAEALFLLVDLLVTWLAQKEFIVERWIPSCSWTKLTDFSEPVDYLRYLGVAAVLGVGAFVLDAVCLKKKDLV